MNRSQRMSAILELLGEAGRLSIEDLVDRLGISPATARRDLDALAAQQLLTRTRGGATQHAVAYDLPLRYKQGQRAPEKERIAQAASSLVPVGAVVGLSGGTTTTAIAETLTTRPDLTGDPNGTDVTLTVVTNAINIASLLVVRPQIKTVVTGGVVHARSYELVGGYSEIVLARISLDLAFIGVNGLDPQIGATVHDEGEAAINALLARRAARSVIVTDSSKLGRRAFASLAEAEGLRTLITDDGITDQQHREFVDAGYDVIVA